MILDIFCLIVIIVFAVIGIKTGAAKVIFRLLSVICAFVAALFLSHFLAELVYNVFIRHTIIDNISNVVNNTALSTASEKSAELLSSLPVLLSNSLDYFGFTEAKLTEMFSTSAVTGIEGAIMTPVVGAISIVFFVILFLVLLFVFKKLFGGISKIFRLPFIRVVDSLLGFVLGLSEGILVLCVLAFVLKLIIPLTGGSVYIINETYISESYIFSLFYFGGFISLAQSFIYSFSNI
ncbi:MAG: CvpA family protein [Clostridia bacterium]|nr:CvpA family protein [Clostridia bacterium]